VRVSLARPGGPKLLEADHSPPPRWVVRVSLARTVVPKLLEADHSPPPRRVMRVSLARTVVPKLLEADHSPPPRRVMRVPLAHPVVPKPLEADHSPPPDAWPSSPKWVPSEPAFTRRPGQAPPARAGPACCRPAIPACPAAAAGARPPLSPPRWRRAAAPAPSPGRPTGPPPTRSA
jgi:hypothetical protein